MTIDLISVLQWIISTLVVGGALWKGLDSVASALSKKADADIANRRLDFETMQANYENAMKLIDQQAERIETLHRDMENYEQRSKDREARYVEEIESLKTELEEMKVKYQGLLYRNNVLEKEYTEALERIEKLEKGDTGPLKKG